MWNFDSTLLFSEQAKTVREKRLEILHHDVGNKKFIADFCIIPNSGFLSNADPLVKDVELKLSFDRSDVQQYMITTQNEWDKLEDVKVDIKNC